MIATHLMDRLARSHVGEAWTLPPPPATRISLAEWHARYPGHTDCNRPLTVHPHYHSIASLSHLWHLTDHRIVGGHGPWNGVPRIVYLEPRDVTDN